MLQISVAASWAAEHDLLLDVSAGINIFEAIEKSEWDNNEQSGTAKFVSDPGLVLNLMFAKNSRRWFGGGEAGFMNTALKCDRITFQNKTDQDLTIDESKIFAYHLNGTGGYYFISGNTRAYIGGGAGGGVTSLLIEHWGAGHSLGAHGFIQSGIISKGSDIISLGVSVRTDYFHPLTECIYKNGPYEIKIKPYWLPISLNIHLAFNL